MTAKPVLFKRKAKVITISVNKKLGIILKTTTSVIVALVVLLAFLLVGVRLFGLQVYTVLSGSMEPDYPTGSLIYVRKIDPTELEVRDVITFKLSGGTTATHRIVELVPDENDPDIMRFRTKGDANDTADGSLVEADSVVGTPVFVLPYLGYLASFIRNPPGMTINNCVSNDNGGLTDLKAAIEIGNDYNKSYELIVSNTVVNGYEINDKGINTGSTLWANKNSMGTDKLNVVVDGVDVY